MERLGDPWSKEEWNECIRKCRIFFGIMVLEVFRAFPDEWTELLVVTEFVWYATPGPHGYSPRDLDRRWSLGTPLEKELQGFQVLEFEPVSDWARKLFGEYTIMRDLVLKHAAQSSSKRAELANRFRKSRTIPKASWSSTGTRVPKPSVEGRRGESHSLNR